MLHELIALVLCATSWGHDIFKTINLLLHFTHEVLVWIMCSVHATILTVGISWIRSMSRYFSRRNLPSSSEKALSITILIEEWIKLNLRC